MINYLAVLVCAIAALAIGMIWYGKALFGKAWMKVTGMETMTPEAQSAMKKKMGGMIFLQFIMSLVSVYVLAYFMTLLPALSGVHLAFWIWLGFLMPTAAGAAIWSGKARSTAWTMFFVTAGAELVTFLVFGLILGAWH
jgi:hypothetical protein